MSALSIDDSQWPLVKIQIDGPQSDAEVSALLRKLEELLEREEPYLVLAAIRRFSPDFEHVKRLARWTLDNADRAKDAVAATALVIPSETFRLLLSAFFLITPMPCPFHTCTDLDEAVDWLSAQGSERGITASL